MTIDLCSKQNSDLETELFRSAVDQLKKTQMTKIQNSLIWIYVKTWGKKAQHLIDEKALWNFGVHDLEAAIMGVAYPRQKTKGVKNKINCDLNEELRKLIMEKFENDKTDFYEWSQSIHDEV